jgi:hypothetical protein
MVLPSLFVATGQKARSAVLVSNDPVVHAAGGSSPATTRSFVLAMLFAPELCPRHQKPSQEASPKSPPLKKKGGGAPKGADRAASKSDAARALSPALPFSERTEAGALAFRRPTAALAEVFSLGSAQAALPGITGCKREDPLRHQCSEHLAARHAPDGTMPKPPVSAVYRYAAREPLPLRLKEYPREGVLRRAGFWECNRDRNKVKGNVALLGTARRPISANVVRHPNT